MQIAIYGDYGVKLTLNEYTPMIRNHLGYLHLTKLFKMVRMALKQSGSCKLVRNIYIYFLLAFLSLCPLVFVDTWSVPYHK